MDREYLSGDLRQRMQDLLKERKITQAEIAAQMEMSEAALSRFFSGDTDKLSSEAVRKAALYLNVSTDFLMGLSNFPERYNMIYLSLLCPIRRHLRCTPMRSIRMW